MENLACYIIRASFSQERMTYVREAGQVVYQSKNGSAAKVFDALEWLAAMCSHVLDRGEQMVRYYGYYSNVSRGKRHKAGRDDEIECILEPELSDGEFRKSWARLIRKVYEVDPLVCPRCAGPMRVIAFIEDEAVIKGVTAPRCLGVFNPRPRSTYPQNFGAVDLAGAQFRQGLVGLFQGEFLDCGTDGHLGGQGQKFRDVAPGDVGHTLDLLFQPQVGGIVPPQEFVLVQILIRVLPFRQGLELAVECLAADAQNPGGPGAASADELEHGQDMLALHLL